MSTYSRVQSASEIVSLTDYFISTEDYVTASFRSVDEWNERRRLSSELWQDPLGKHPLESDGQVQANDEKNFPVPPVHLPVHGEEPTSVKFIRCQYTVKQKQLVVLYVRHHRVCPTERKFGIL